MKGRKPTPTRIKLLKGNPGKRKIRQRPSPSGGALPKCPRHLDREAQAEWARISPELAQCGLLTTIDRAALAAYCQAWARWVAAERKLKKTRVMVKTRNGYPMQNPYLAIANKAMAQMHSLLVEFGMTPSSRSRIESGRNMNPPTDALDSFLRVTNGKTAG